MPNTDAANIYTVLGLLVITAGTVTTAWFAYRANGSAKQASAQTQQLTEATRTNRKSEGNIGTSIDQLHDRLDVVQGQLGDMAALPGQVRRVSKQQLDEHDVLGKLVAKVDQTAARVTALELHSADRVVVDAVNFAELGQKIDRIGGVADDPA